MKVKKLLLVCFVQYFPVDQIEIFDRKSLFHYIFSLLYNDMRVMKLNRWNWTEK